VLVFKAISSPPGGSANPHVARWYTHIKSYAAEHESLAGSSTAGEAFLGKAADAAATPAPAAAEEDDEIDLFGDDEEEDADAEKLKAERVAAYNAKKANKPKAAAKVCRFFFSSLKVRYHDYLIYSQSVVTMDVKPWDDETDMVALEKAVRSIEQDGLVWGASKLVPIGYGIKKLQITLVVGA
jgi:elongation factor 1-beta